MTNNIVQKGFIFAGLSNILGVIICSKFFTNDVMSGLLSSSLETAALDENGFHDVGTTPGSDEGKYINWLTISHQTGSVVEDVKRVRNHPLVPKNIPIYGYLYDVKTGKLIEVAEATEVGKAA